MKAVARVGLAIGVSAVLSAALFASRTITATQPPLPAIYAAMAAGIDAPADQRPSGGESGAVDLYGNEVTDAIATYSIDPTGTLYELHSPQTELPRLASPKS